MATMPRQSERVGRFNEPVAELVKRYTASVDFDKRLALFDYRAHWHTPDACACSIISGRICGHSTRLAQIENEVTSGDFVWQLDLEDVHLNIEETPYRPGCDRAKRLHTGRSRKRPGGDRHPLVSAHSIDDIILLLKGLQTALLDLHSTHTHTIMPGFTHLQVAQPVSFAHHLMAYFEMCQRDVERFSDARRRVNRLPLGAAALAGTSYPIKREMVARPAGLRGGMPQNSLDAVSDRDFAIEFTAAAALTMTHLSRLSEELISG